MRAESGTLLVVDDEEFNRDLLCKRLEVAGYKTHMASGGAQALDAVATRPFDAILLDWEMPQMSGMEVLASLRKTHSAIELPIIMVTARDQSVDIVEALGQGANDYITKPVDMAVCRARLRSHLTLRSTSLLLKETLEELAARNSTLEQLNNEKNQFLGMAAHDLRGPLGVIKYYAEFLGTRTRVIPDDKREKFLAQIKTSSEFMLRLVDDLLSVTRIESGRLELSLEDVDLTSLTTANVMLNALLAQDKLVNVVLEPAASMPRARIDRGKIEQVLTNLITNAVKFSHPPSSVRVSLVHEGDWIRVSVVDRGQGIPAEELPKMFQPFQQLSVKSTGGEQSTGLGLVIVRRIVEGHGGRIWVESTVGQGSTFHFTVPCSPGTTGVGAVP